MSQPTILNPSQGAQGSSPVAKGDGTSQWSLLLAPYKPLLRGAGALISAAGAGTRVVGYNVLTTSQGTVGIPLLWIAAADFTVAGFTPMLRTRLVAAANGTAPASTLTLGLYPVTSGGAANGITYTPGTVVTSSTAAIASLGSSAIAHAESSDFALPGDGAYLLGINSGSTTATGSFTDISATVEIHFV